MIAVTVVLGVLASVGMFWGVWVVYTVPGSVMAVAPRDQERFDG